MYIMNKELVRIIEQSSLEDLSEAQRTISIILETRRNKAKEEAWRKLTNAIKDYATIFGDIEVNTYYETFQINSTDDYSSIGEIYVKFD